MMERHTFLDPSALAQALATTVAESLRRAVAERSRAALVVSGGSTPKPFFEELRTRSLPWEKVTVTLADERCVPPADPESNERLVRETLLQEQAAAARWVSLLGEGAAVTAAVTTAVTALQPFDVVILGMGSDGHTASLFPDDPQVAAALDPDGDSVWVKVPALPGRQPRISLTLPTLLKTRRTLLHITGEEKDQVLHQAVGEPERYPIGAVLQAAERKGGGGVEIYWAPERGAGR